MASADPAPVQTPATSTSLTVLLHDTLAFGNRLWLRGRALLPAQPEAERRGAWWKRWRQKPAPAEPLRPVRIQTEVAGETLVAEAPLAADGQFEVLLEASLPPSRRGWRVARNQITAAGEVVRACSVVLTPPTPPSAVLVAVLPLACTHQPGGVQAFAHSSAAAPLTDLFQRLRRQAPADGPVYYLCAVPPGAEAVQGELALAATALGWPQGHFALMAAPRSAAAEALAHGLDRLRWLFAGGPPLLVLNREPSADALLREATMPRSDRASVDRFIGTTEGAASILAAEVPAVFIAPSAQRARSACVPRFPVVFCHGMLAMSMLRMQIPEDSNYFSHLRSFFRERGVPVLYPNVEPTGGVCARAEQLRDQIRRWTDEPINLIAHSMGGLDARCLISRLGMADRVRSLTTVATPHRGSALADWFCQNFRHRVPLLLTLEALGVNVDGFRDCRRDACGEFNSHTPDAPGVRYFSFSATVTSDRISPLLRRGWSVLSALEGPNDGLVSLASARWGEEVGTLHVDHFAQTPDGLFLREGESFDALGFYARVVEDLARRGL